MNKHHGSSLGAQTKSSHPVTWVAIRHSISLLQQGSISIIDPFCGLAPCFHSCNLLRRVVVFASNFGWAYSALVDTARSFTERGIHQPIRFVSLALSRICQLIEIKNADRGVILFVGIYPQILLVGATEHPRSRMSRHRPPPSLRR